MPEFAKISHISFSARDKEASARWLAEVLGFKEFERVERAGWSGVLLIHPQTNTVIEYQQHDANTGVRFDPAHTGFDHMGFMVSARAELDDWQAHFERLGVDFTPISEQEYGAVLTFRDPDGVQLEMFYREGHP